MARLVSRLLLVAVVAVAAACSSGSAARPSASTPRPSPTPARPTPTVVIGSVPPASLLPSDLFRCDLAANRIDISLHTPHGIVDAPETLAEAASPTPTAGESAAPTDDGSAAPTSQAPTTPSAAAPSATSAGSASPAPAVNAGELVGLHSYTVDFALDLGDHQQRIAPKTIDATVSVPGASQPAIVSRQDTSAGITLPDGHGGATLTLVLAFADEPCPDLLATVRIGFRLVASATAGACPTDQPGYAALIADLKPQITIGPVTRAFAVQTYAARYENIAAAAEVPPFPGFNPTVPAAPITQAKSVRIASATDAITFTEVAVRTWRRADVVGTDGRVVPTADPIDTQVLTANSGAVTWPAPKTPGDYVVGIDAQYTQSCMTGQGYLYLSVHVT